MNRDIHNKLGQARRSRRANVVSVQFDAAFFYERGVRFLQKNDLQKALRAFRRTVEFEPNNPVNHCNLAGVLSELGDFEASNHVLLHVLGELDPNMAECTFFLANNYAHMGEYETAEEYVLRYLDAEPDGEYAEDAEEMLGLLLEEFGGGKAYARWEDERRQEEHAAAMRDGRHLLEEGQFEAAVDWLENMVRRDASNTAARNNLSLAYYYTGQYERALEMAEGVLASHPDNLHALCNVAVFRAQLGQRDRLVESVAQLEKIFPLHYDHAVKIGITLGLVGEHEAALRVFERLLRLTDWPDPSLYHSIAAAAANAGRLGTARKWWKSLTQTPDFAEVAQYYLREVDRARTQGKKAIRVGYQYDLPLQVQLMEMKHRLNDGTLSVWRQEPLLRASLHWGLRHGTEETRKAVIRTLALLADDDAERALRLFLKRSEISSTLLSATLFALQRCRARGRVELWKDGALTSIRMSDIPKDVILQADPVWLEIWQQVAVALRTHHKSRYVGEAKRAWITFLKYAFLRSEIRIVKPEIWVGGLLYATLKHHGEPIRQREAAEMFRVSVSSIRKAVGMLDAFFVKMPEV